MMGHLLARIGSAEGGLDGFPETMLNCFFETPVLICSLFFHLIKVVNCGLRADLEGKHET